MYMKHSVHTSAEKKISSGSRKKQLTVKQMCLFAVYGAAMFVCKTVMASLPNIEPVSLMVLLAACVFGWKGLWSIYVYVFLEYSFWGLNLWSISYLYVWLILFAAARICRHMTHPVQWAFLGAVFGFSFGALCAIPYIGISGFSGAVSWWVSGIPFDLAHGTGNFILIFLLFKPLKNGLEKICQRAAL